jgi:hypothetical protein
MTMTTPANEEEPTSVGRVEAVAAAVELTGEVAGLRKALLSLAVSQAKLRRLSRLLMASLLFDLMLTVGIGALSVTNHTLTTRLHQAQVTACRGTNNLRKDIVQFVGGLTNPKDPKDAPILAKVHHEFKPVDCSKVN